MAFVLRLFGANADAPFAEWVYRTSDSLMRPFRGIFPPHQITDTSIFDASLLFGALMYLIVALLIDALLRWLTHRLRMQEQKAHRRRANADAAAQQLASTSATPWTQAALRRSAAAGRSVAPSPTPRLPRRSPSTSASHRCRRRRAPAPRRAQRAIHRRARPGTAAGSCEVSAVSTFAAAWRTDDVVWSILWFWPVLHLDLVAHRRHRRPLPHVMIRPAGPRRSG